MYTEPNVALCSLFINSLTCLLNAYLVFSTQIQRYYILMNQSVVSKINVIDEHFQH